MAERPTGESLEAIEAILQRLLATLGPDLPPELRDEVTGALQRGECEVTRIAVLGSFNRGKSTLLNAILGEVVLPSDLIPKTALPIEISYGQSLGSRIELVDGRTIEEPGNSLLEAYAASRPEGERSLEARRAELFSPNELLKRGVQLIDLPGTGDSERRDRLVEVALGTVDLVIQVFDARQLLTLDEKDALDKLLNRGVKGIVFILNFMNLLSCEEQKSVWQRASDFLAGHPSRFALGLLLFRVDALPALRACRLKDLSAMEASGLISFRDALSKIVDVAKREAPAMRRSRLHALRSQLESVGRASIQRLQADLAVVREKQNVEAADRARRLNVYRRNYEHAIDNLRVFLTVHLSDAARPGKFDGTVDSGWLTTIDESLKALVRAANLAVREAAIVGAKVAPDLQIELILANLPLPCYPSFDANRKVAAGARDGFLIGCLFCGVGCIPGMIIGRLLAHSRALTNHEAALVEYESRIEARHRQVVDFLQNLNERGWLAVIDFRAKADPLFQIQWTQSPMDCDLTRRLESLKSLF